MRTAPLALAWAQVLGWPGPQSGFSTATHASTGALVPVVHSLVSGVPASIMASSTPPADRLPAELGRNR